MTNSDSRDIIIQQNLYHINIANSAVRVVVRVKETLIRAIINMGVNISIITLFVVKKLQMIMEMSDESKIISINQTKKNVISIIKDALLSIQNIRVLVSLLIIDVLEDNLLLGMD